VLSAEGTLGDLSKKKTSGGEKTLLLDSLLRIAIGTSDAKELAKIFDSYGGQLIADAKKKRTGERKSKNGGHTFSEIESLPKGGFCFTWGKAPLFLQKKHLIRGEKKLAQIAGGMDCSQSGGRTSQ